MNKPINSNKTKDFNSLLEELKNPSGELDAFEQEALEGFALIGNEKEIRESKQKVDERMEELTEQRKRPLYLYWGAAAGVVLMLGVFVLFKNNFTEKSPSLALNQPVHENSSDLNKNTVLPPSENSTAEAPAKETKLETARSNKNQDDVIPLKDKEPAEAAKKEVGSAAESEKSNSYTLGNSSTASGSSENIPVAPGSAAAKPAPENQAGPPAPPEDKKPKEKSSAEDADMKSRGDEEGPVTPKSFLEKKKKSAAPAQATRTEPEGSYEKSSIGIASITISEQELKAKIDKYFGKPENRKAFSCNLTIGSSGSVDEIVFEDKKELKKSEIKELENFLKKLTCFKPAAYAPYSVYKLSYKP